MLSHLVKPAVRGSILLASLAVTTGYAADRLPPRNVLSQETILDGDIIIRDDSAGRAKRSAPKLGGSLWPNNTMYYSLSRANTRLVMVFNQAKQYLEANTAVRFVERTTEADYVEITSAPLRKGLHGRSKLGKVGGAQPLEIREREESERRGVVLHELLHALGLGHEHQRSDRDKYVQRRAALGPLHSGNLGLINADLDTDSPYDFESIMHYSDQQARDPSKQRLFKDQYGAAGDTVELSAGDIAALYKLYPDSTGRFRPASLSHSKLPLQAGAGPGYLANIVTVYPGSRHDLDSISVLESPRGIRWRLANRPDGTGQVEVWPEPGFTGEMALTLTLHFRTGEPQTLRLPIEVVAASEEPLLQHRERQLGPQGGLIIPVLPPGVHVTGISEVRAGQGLQWRSVAPTAPTDPTDPSKIVVSPVAGFKGRGSISMKLHLDSGTTQRWEVPIEVLAAAPDVLSYRYPRPLIKNAKYDATVVPPLPAWFRVVRLSDIRTQGIKWQTGVDTDKGEMSIAVLDDFSGSEATLQMTLHSEDGDTLRFSMTANVQPKVCELSHIRVRDGSIREYEDCTDGSTRFIRRIPPPVPAR